MPATGGNGHDGKVVGAEQSGDAQAHLSNGEDADGGFGGDGGR